MSNINPGSSRQMGTKAGSPWKKQSRDTYGDIMRKKKKKKRIRVVFQNINGLMVEDEENDKREYIKEFINKYNVDVFGLAEVNVN